jgi:hypothetical protein
LRVDTGAVTGCGAASRTIGLCAITAQIMAPGFFTMMLDHVLTPAGDALADAFGWLFADRPSSGPYQTFRVGVLVGIFTIELTAYAFGAVFE